MVSTLFSWPALTQRSVRLRLTALYGGLFLVSSAGLLALTYLLVLNATAGGFVTTVTGTAITPSGAPAGTATSHAIELHQLLVQSGIALAIMTVVSTALGWIVAGRVLAPVRKMTEATRRISDENLHERLAMSGPRDELTELAATIDELLDRLEVAFDAQRRFVANASHELRTPLAMMRTSLDVAIAKPTPIPAEVSALDGKLREGLDQADRLLESFLILARAQHGAPDDDASVSLAELVEAALRDRRVVIAEKGIDVHVSLAAAMIAGSGTLLSRMVENVIDNAVLHNEPSGFIVVESEVDGGVVRLCVENGGRRLDDGGVEQLGRPFQRLGAERTGSSDGVGLGLSIVAAVAAAHGGGLELRARSAGGLRVEITLPLAVPALAPVRVAS
ncbi:MAG TPA: HAMP domain-containing sensor histidine kinase [Solirubrobacteraceae bacterium]|nr:HAMP domain-containing sensor histidine kinase [Solirubrobacteraceae bacterium]